jgi:DNA-directed RNA polymerase specialized sigma24 family protein
MHMMSNEPSRGEHPRFGTTRWSLILLASDSGSNEGSEALGELIQTYWYPLYAYSRRRGNDEHDACDVTQGFFAALLEEKKWAVASRTRGRFRSFLLASFKNYLANWKRDAKALKRGGGIKIHPLEIEGSEHRFKHEPFTDETAEQLYERCWVDSLLSRVDTRLREDYQRAGRDELFRMLHPHLMNRSDALPRETIGSELKLSPAAIAMSLHRMRQRYAELARDEVAVTVESPDDIDDEIRHLMAIVSTK